MTLSVSVIVPAYNHARYVAEAIESALTQTLRPVEIFVMDDGSTDETPVVLAAYKGRVNVIRTANRGVAAARNAGAALATGDLVAFLDADDVWLPTKLERQVACFEASSCVGLVHCAVEKIDADGRRIGEITDGLDGEVADELLLFRRPVVLGGGSGAVFRRSCFESIGGFDERLSTSADWDLHYRMASRWRVGFVSEKLLRYRLHGSNMHGNVRAMERDMMLAYSKAFSGTSSGLRRMRRMCYGNLHMVLAGSFFAAGQPAGFVRHAIKSLVLTPGNATWFAGYPTRLFQRYVGARARRERMASGG